MNAAICDDERENTEKLENAVRAFFKEKDISVGISCFTKGSELISSINSGTEYDAIFMDINLVTEDGISIIAKLRDTGVTVPVIFVTSYENRAIDGYDVDAFAFVVKKNMGEKLPKVLQKLYSHLYEKRTVTVSTKDGIQLVNVDDILYIESENRSTLVHTFGGSITDTRSVTHFAGLLSTDDFVEVHKSVYVSIPRIKRINADTVELEEGTILPLSRRNRKPVMYAVMKKVGGQ